MQPIISLVVAFLSLPTPAPAEIPKPATTLSPSENFETMANSLYHEIDFADSEKTDTELFMRGLSGYYQIRENHKLSDEKELLTLIDFRKSSKEKRLWVIDLRNKKVIFHSLVAHGRNTGDDFARKFSNTPNSNQSSLGFYVTGNTYVGKHGISLKLHGVEEGINHLAEQRAIVMHGADYVSESYVNRVGRLGRSFGCPAIPMDIYKKMVTELANGTVMFIYYPDEMYLATSRILNASAM
jgi:hypothetical protein